MHQKPLFQCQNQLLGLVRMKSLLQKKLSHPLSLDLQFPSSIKMRIRSQNQPSSLIKKMRRKRKRKKNQRKSKRNQSLRKRKRNQSLRKRKRNQSLRKKRRRMKKLSKRSMRRKFKSSNHFLVTLKNLKR